MTENYPLQSRIEQTLLLSTSDQNPSPQPISPLAGDDETSHSAVTVYERTESLGSLE